MAQQMQINAEVVQASYNSIAQYSAEITGWLEKFIRLLDEKNQQTSGKFPLIKALQPKIQEECENVKKAEASLEEVKISINKYLAMAEEAVDTSMWQ